MKKLLLLLFLIPNLVMGELLSVRCNFTEGVSTDFDSGSPNLGGGGKFKDIVFDQIDLKKELED
jgi:hypothetical protein